MKILQPNSKNIIVGCIYKPPDTSVSTHFADFLEFISTLNISFSSIGVSETCLHDFNENLYSIPVIVLFLILDSTNLVVE